MPDRLVLASASPRRRELLALAGAEFEVVVPAVEELTAGRPADLVVENALRKARAGAAIAGGPATVLGVDTDVALDGALLGKPADADRARSHLQALAGRTHEVLSGIALVCQREELSELVTTAVTFRELGSEEIEAYVESGEWEDRAGGYAIQGLGASLVERVDGDLSNVIGLPIPALSRMIAGLHDD